MADLQQILKKNGKSYFFVSESLGNSLILHNGNLIIKNDPIISGFKDLDLQKNKIYYPHVREDNEIIIPEDKIQDENDIAVIKVIEKLFHENERAINYEQLQNPRKELIKNSDEGKEQKFYRLQIRDMEEGVYVDKDYYNYLTGTGHDMITFRRDLKPMLAFFLKNARVGAILPPYAIEKKI